MSARTTTAAASALLVLLVLLAGCRANDQAALVRGPRPQEDRFTRYELGPADSHAFEVTHEIALSKPGARACLQYLRGGVIVSSPSATDLASGLRLPVALVDGQVAREHGYADAEPKDNYLIAPLARPIPAGGEARLAIGLWIEDPESYRFDGDRISFEREIGVERASIVLPKGYELVSIDHPAQLETREDGRLAVGLVQPAAGTIRVALEARRLPESADLRGPRGPVLGSSPGTGLPGGEVLFGRGPADHRVVYRLGSPAKHEFEIVHDVTRSQEGAREYASVVRAGSIVTRARARLLDTGEELAAEIRPGADVLAAGGVAEEEIRPDGSVLVVAHPPVPEGGSLRLRIEESCVDVERYRLEDGEAVWNRGLPAPRDEIVLPAGWYPCASSMPATVREDEQGRIRLVYVNTRPDVLALHLRARPRDPARGGQGG